MEHSAENSNRVALVTGGSRGIGKGIAIQPARDGFDVALCYRGSKFSKKPVTLPAES